jgi:hypothetical protein
MAFGNVLTIYDSTPPIEQGVIAILHTHAAQFEQKESTFFVQTDGMGATSGIVNALRAAGFTFTLVFIFDRTGSALRTHGIGEAQEDGINHLFGLS